MTATQTHTGATAMASLMRTPDPATNYNISNAWVPGHIQDSHPPTVRVAIQYISAIVGMLLAARKLVSLLSKLLAGDSGAGSHMRLQQYSSHLMVTWP